MRRSVTTQIRLWHPNAQYSADAPLRASINDRFQRWPFARRIARVIASRTDPESIVIGINGAWGEGKTTVFNFIEEELVNHPDVVCFRFNPWRFPEENKLIRDFFQSLAGAEYTRHLIANTRNLGSLINKYITIPFRFAGAGDAVEAVGNALSTVDLEELKGRVEAIITQAGKRVVVLMDDIDRLDKNEIQTVFRLVKLVADFQNTAYVLAFDAEMVASAFRNATAAAIPKPGETSWRKLFRCPSTCREYRKIPARILLWESWNASLMIPKLRLSEDGARGNLSQGF